MAEDKKTPNIFQKLLEVSSTMLDAKIYKAKQEIAETSKKTVEDDAEFSFGKAVTRDRSYYIGSQGFYEKAGALSYEYQRQMAIKSSIVSAIVRTRQNRVAAYSEYVPEGNRPGFRIKLKHEYDALQKIREELFGEDTENTGILNDPDMGEAATKQMSTEEGMAKGAVDVSALADVDPSDPIPKPLTEEDMVREAKAELDKRTRKDKLKIANFLLNCGETEDRPFDSKKWNFDALLRSITWDSLVYDQIAIELIPKKAQELEGKLNVHHMQPVDASTIRYASPELSKFKNQDLQVSTDILYPEDELRALEERDGLELDDGRLEKEEYKFVQLIKGKIARGFTQDELKFGVRNSTADIYVNGYSISELEMLVALVTSHLQTEFYNRSYFQQGFSAKGILHIKANLNRSKLEELRRNWNHMVKGNRNSFQTPIMAGMDQVEWIPLTQSHSEMEFSMWLNYLIRMICAIYQIDPSEIGYGIKDEGRGGGLSGDNTKEKLQNSRDKGFVPLMKFMQSYINTSIVDVLDDDYMLEWVGLTDESDMSRIARQKEEIQWKKTLNEVRAEDGLPPIKGCDHLLLNPVYFQWYSTMSEEGKEFQKQQQEQAMASMPGGDIPGAGGGENQEGDQKNWEADEAGKENDHSRNIESKMLDHQNTMEQNKAKKSLNKAMKIEYYKLED